MLSKKQKAFIEQLKEEGALFTIEKRKGGYDKIEILYRQKTEQDCGDYDRWEGFPDEYDMNIGWHKD